MENTFGQDIEFLRKHVNTIVLSAGDAKVAVVPAYQGRVMTSTADGDLSFGWINYDFVAAGKTVPHINVYGGQDRFWLGPEGGQFSIFFKPGDPFDLDHWQTPAVIDTESYDVAGQSESHVVFRKTATLTNWSDARFDLSIDRTIRILDRTAAEKRLGIKPAASVKMVACQSDNRITNEGAVAWTKATGLLSIWILGMYKPSPATTVVIPFKPGPETELGPAVVDDYFGKVPAERLVVKDDVLFFKADGRHRGKIGLSPRRGLPVMGSYDSAAKVLTIVQYTRPEGVIDYVNSKWELQDKPFAGDAANSYNDGPPAPGAEPLGPFYELESSSPAVALAPGGSVTHLHGTFHLQGSQPDLDAIAVALLGVGIDQIKTALPR